MEIIYFGSLDFFFYQELRKIKGTDYHFLEPYIHTTLQNLGTVWLGLLYCTMHHWVRYYLWVRAVYAGFASGIDHLHVLQSCVLYHTGFKYNLKEHLFPRKYFSTVHNTMMQKIKSSLWKPRITVFCYQK